MKDAMKILSYITLTITAFAFAGCNNFLDEVPDKRAELNTPEKCAQLLVSAYTTSFPALLFEYLSDNVDDNGPNYTLYFNAELIENSYYFKDITFTGNDTPTHVWQSTYRAIASANHAIAAIEELSDPEAANGVKAEALLCRAFGHFILANTFCMAYNPESSDTDMGIPYVENPETTVSPTYERGTVAEVYAKIDRDIEEALPMLSESHLTQPKYHFNKRAAYAFAARFNLYYGKWEKVIDYATQAIGENPDELLRDWSKYLGFTVINDWKYLYINASEVANFLIMPLYSGYGRVINYSNRYGHNRVKAYETMWQYFPWNKVVKNFSNAWGTSQAIYVPKVREIFEITDPVAQTGYAHIVLIPFTADETLACRAEARVMLGDYEGAVNDLNYWYRKNSTNGTTYTVDQISNYYATDHVYGSSTRYRVPVMESRFGIEEGIQKNLIGAVLAIRRFDGVFEGLRFPDVKRHGIEVDHKVMITNTESETITLKPYDPRTAIQLPADVIYAGLPANPR